MFVVLPFSTAPSRLPLYEMSFFDSAWLPMTHACVVLSFLAAPGLPLCATVYDRDGRPARFTSSVGRARVQAMAAQSSGVEHSVHIPLPPHGAGPAPPPPERRLNCFVRSVALIERVGNAVGTLAFTWATVVLLGGYPTALLPVDFWFATAIFFLEAVRMVLGQGVLYVVACLLEIFSFIPRRSLVHSGGFKGQWGVDSVNLYYAYALEKCLERNVLAPNISLCNFAIDSINSDSTKRQLHGIRVTHTLLKRDATRTRLLVKLNASTDIMTRLMRMQDWTGQGHETIRLFAVKVIDELAKGLLVVTVPGIVQNVSLLLGRDDQQKGNPFLNADDEQDKQKNDLSVNAIICNQMERGEAVPDDRNLLETQDRSTQQVGNNEQNSWITRWWRQVFEFWSIPQEGPLTEHDLLPVLGMSIIESLATYDQINCEEISKANGLIRKITRFTRFCRSDTNYTDAEKKVLAHSSLKLFHRLTSIHGEVGITLRQKISNHPFLLRNLSEILGGITSCHEPRELAAGILRNLAVDASTRQTIGGVQSIITRLMRAFLTPDMPSSTDGDRLLRKVAGQALAMLAMDNINNCLAMLRETRYSFIKDLTTMIHIARYRCVAASLLRSVCMHARPELKEEDLDALSYSSREVLEIILFAEGLELEIFVGLSSHIYKAIPEEFAREFENRQIKETFVKRLVDALNANMEPSADCPGIRRVILEQAINLMEYDSSNVNCFVDRRMIEVLSMVEETMSDAENYSIFLGDAGLMEAGQPLSSLVARAKQLLGVS